MNRPTITLQPSKGVVTQAAATIYGAYIASGAVKGDEDHAQEWLKRSIREAIMIARMVDASVQSSNELPAVHGAEEGSDPAG